MTWKLKEALPGDIIRAKVGPLYHYGVFVSENEIIQFGLNPLLRKNIPDPQIEVCVSDMETFLCGEFLEVGELEKGLFKAKRNSPKKTIEIAKSRIGEKGYNLLYNNCEHFAYECVMGKSYCSQTERVRNLFRNIPITDVYLAKIPNSPVGRVSCFERDEHIQNTPNENLKRQRYFVWKLLEYALSRTFGKKAEDISFSKTENGKWTCSDYFFSLSHTDELVAVAVSRSPIGVDVESALRPFSEKIAEKILTEAERSEYENTAEESKSDYLLEKWTAKESVFKKSDSAVFSPSETETCALVKTSRITVDDNEYCLSVASDNLDKLRIFENIKL